MASLSNYQPTEVNQEAKAFYENLVKNENWEDSFNWANSKFKGANGANEIFKHISKVNFTDGVGDLCNQNQCFWFLDMIAFTESKFKAQEEFQAWYLLIQEGKNYVICEDGNQNVLKAFLLPFTDFTEYGFNAVYLMLNYDTILLPEEY